MKKIVSVSVICIFTSLLFPTETVKVASWNIEHLGSPGRGLGGIGSGNLPGRTDEQLRSIANFIKNEIKVDLLAIQEVAITDQYNGQNISEPVEKIIDELGEDWSYHVGNPGHETVSYHTVHNQQNAFIWNSKKVRLRGIFDFTFSNEIVGYKRLFDRLPLVGYFQALKNSQDTNDFLLVNVHLTSGQDNDENHLVAMVIIEQNLNNLLKANSIKESDRIILGDFNDNPFAKKSGGELRYSDYLYRYMTWKKYTNLVNESVGSTRMDNNLTSIIDHVLVNSSAMRHLKNNSFRKYMPQNPTTSNLAAWRKIYSDHFPLIFEIKVANSDDDVD